MPLVSPLELAVLLLGVGVIWNVNHYLIVSGIFTRLTHFEDDATPDDDEGVVVAEISTSSRSHNSHYSDHRSSLGEGSSIESESSEEQQRRMTLLYEAIYGDPLGYFNSDEVRTVMWMGLAFFLNIILIQLELLLFDELIANPYHGPTILS